MWAIYVSGITHSSPLVPLFAKHWKSKMALYVQKSACICTYANQPCTFSKNAGAVDLQYLNFGFGQNVLLKEELWYPHKAYLSTRWQHKSSVSLWMEIPAENCAILTFYFLFQEVEARGQLCLDLVHLESSV